MARSLALDAVVKRASAGGDGAVDRRLLTTLRTRAFDFLAAFAVDAPTYADRGVLLRMVEMTILVTLRYVVTDVARRTQGQTALDVASRALRLRGVDTRAIDFFTRIGDDAPAETGRAVALFGMVEARTGALRNEAAWHGQAGFLTFLGAGRAEFALAYGGESHQEKGASQRQK